MRRAVRPKAACDRSGAQRRRLPRRPGTRRSHRAGRAPAPIDDRKPVIIPVPYGDDALGGPRLEVLRQMHRAGSPRAMCAASSKCARSRAATASSATPPKAFRWRRTSCRSPAATLSAILTRTRCQPAQRESLGFANLANEFRAATRGALDIQLSPGDATGRCRGVSSGLGHADRGRMEPGRCGQQSNRSTFAVTVDTGFPAAVVDAQSPRAVPARQPAFPAAFRRAQGCSRCSPRAKSTCSTAAMAFASSASSPAPRERGAPERGKVAMPAAWLGRQLGCALHPLACAAAVRGRLRCRAAQPARPRRHASSEPRAFPFLPAAGGGGRGAADSGDVSRQAAASRRLLARRQLHAARRGSGARARGSTSRRSIAVSPVLDPGETLHAIESGFTAYHTYFIRKWGRSLAEEAGGVAIGLRLRGAGASREPAAHDGRDGEAIHASTRRSRTI